MRRNSWGLGTGSERNITPFMIASTAMAVAIPKAIERIATVVKIGDFRRSRKARRIS